MTKFLASILSLTLFISCGTAPRPQFSHFKDVRVQLDQFEAGSCTATLVNKTEASGSEWSRVVQLDVVKGHATSDSTFGLAWILSDAYTSEGETSLTWGRLWANELTSIGSDSSLQVNPVDPASHRNGNGIPNYYASLALPVMLHDSTWWSDFAGDSLVEVTWEHQLPSRDQIELFIMTATDIPQPSDEDYHPDSKGFQRWAFRAPDGLPVSYEQSWFRGDMAYGSDMRIEWDWSNEPAASLMNKIGEWVAPSWSKLEEKEEQGIAGGGSGENWYEEAIAALPAVGMPAPNLTGASLQGGMQSLEALRGQLIYLDFWYIGCGPCMRALPHLAAMQAQHSSNGFTVLGVNPYQDSATVNRYLDRRGIELPQMLLDSLPSAYPVQAYPTWFLIGRDGEVIARDMGYGEGSEQFLDSLVTANL
jgi:thiol-disulfide isomerase/thioredoxin